VGRLIEIDPSRRRIPRRVIIVAGDVLLIRATGGHVRSGEDAVHLLGALLTALLRENGHIIAPLGAPNRVIFVAQAAGDAVIDVVTGEPWGEFRTTILNVSVKESR